MTADTVLITGSSTTGNTIVLPVTIDTRSTADVAKVSGDSAAADNLELDYDGTGYSRTNSSIGTAENVSNTVNADVIFISGDPTAANNLESDYDGTGYNKSASTIGTCTSNTDMRGTDNALLAASAPTNFGDLAITATTGQVTVGTNNDKTGYSISGTKTTLDALNDVAATDIVSGGAITTSAGVANANAVQISSDSIAADNLEATYDGSGYANDAAPATQQQLNNIALTGSALNVSYASVAVNTGSVAAGVPDNTIARDGVYYQLADTGGTLDVEFDFQIGVDGVPTGVTLFGYLNSSNDTVLIQGYDWNAAQYRTMQTISGTNGSTATELNGALFTSMVGTGANEGVVRIRLYGSGLTTSDTFVDQLYISYATVNRSVGYAEGKVWINSASSNTGTEAFIDGTADRPVNSYANAVTVANAVGLRGYSFSPGDVATLSQSHAADFFDGSNYQVSLNNQAPPTSIMQAEVTGIANGSTTHYIRESRCGTTVTPLTLNTGCVMELCGIVDVRLKDQAGAALDIEFLDCHGNTQGSMYPGGEIDFGTTAGTNHEVAFERWGGPVTIKNLKAGDTVFAHGNGTFFLDASCTGGDFRVDGMINLVDNSGSVNLFQDGRLTRSLIADSIWDELKSGHAVAGSFGADLSVFDAATDEVSADVVKINGSASAAIRQQLAADQILPGTVDTASFTPSTTQFEADDITEPTADHYNGRIIIFTSGALIGQATDITDYEKVGSNGRFTVTAITEAPANDSTFIIL
jgi:hypothetical protein